MRISDLRIATRLYLGFGAIVVLLVTLVTVAYANFSKLGQANDINIHTYEVTGEVNAALASLINIETGQRGFALTGGDASLEPYVAGKTQFLKHLGNASTLTSDNPAQQERLKRLGVEQSQWLATAVDPIIALRRAGTDAEMAAVVAAVKEGKGKRGMDAMRALIAEIIAAEETLLAQRAKDAAALQSQTGSILLFGGLFAVIIAAIIALWQARNIVLPLRSAVALAKQVAEGDLTLEVRSTSGDEIGELLASLAQMNTSLARIVGEVRSGTDTIATASSQIKAGNMDLSSRTEHQASSLEETASAMEELTSTVNQNADNARQANSLAGAASDVAEKGGAAVAQVIDTMSAINESAKKIVDIIGVIDGIAFQTNILALNAAVEAARAGEQGRGFAVVAAEVRNLAQRSASAAKEIKSLIDTSVEEVGIGTRLVDQAGVTMGEVVSSVRRVNAIIGEIASASEEQRAGIEQVNQAIAQMDEVTQQNAALVEEATAASASMESQAMQLASTVSVFKLAASAQVAPPAPRLAPAAARPAPMARRPAQARLQKSAQSLPQKARATAPVAEDDWEQF